MKKSISILLLFTTLVVGTSGFATEYFTIGEVLEQAGTGWHKTYSAHGREIVVDVDAMVPDVKSVPVSKCKYSEYPPNITDGTGLILEHNLPDAFAVSSTMLTDEIIVQSPNKKLGLPFSITTYYSPIDLDRLYFSGYPLTLRKICMRFRDMLALVGIDPDGIVMDSPYMLTVNEYYNAEKGEEVVPSYGWASFYQLMHRVPILGGLGEAYEQMPLYGTYAELGFVLSHEDFFVSVHTITEIERLAEDVPLSSFSKVIASFEEEIEDGHIRKVYDLNFGYAVCSAIENGGAKKNIDPNDRFYIVPVWMANCMYVTDAKKGQRVYDESYGTDERNALEYQKIMVNAQTGELIDPMNRSQNRGYYTGFITWDDVCGKP